MILRVKFNYLKINSSLLRTVFDLDKKRKEFEKLKKEVQDSNLWNNKKKAIEVSQKFNQLKQELNDFEELKLEIEYLDEKSDIGKIEKKLEEKEIEIFFSEKYDDGEAILSLYAGVGGQDAQDWTAMLLRMYQRYCERKKFAVKILSQSFGDDAGFTGRTGIKSVTLEVRGKFAYGFLKKEKGVHRLVRISPFSSKNIRQTSFALVDVIPKIKDLSEEKIQIKPEDITIDTYRASGPGGQYVNKIESAVRIKHLPTNIIATCQSERSQDQNKKRAMEVLCSRLYNFYKDKEKKKISEIKGEKVSVGWGNQVRNYVFHPYQLVKDLRTGIETSNINKVLDGEIEEFIEAEIKLKND